MTETEAIHLRLMTYNVGGVKQTEFSIDDVLEVIKNARPDLLAIQEVTERVDLDGNWVRLPSVIAQALGYGDKTFFGPTISMREHFHPKKALFVKGIFGDWKDWWQGNALFSRWPFVRLGDPSRPGQPQNLPLYRPAIYEGSRDTDPRYMILARVGYPALRPFAIATHLTTVIGEHDREDQPGIQNSERARTMRWQQSQRLLETIRSNLLVRDEFVILMGDMNAAASEPCISDLLENEGRFVRLAPVKPVPTHPKLEEPIDHILVHPGNRRVEYKCWVVDNTLARGASDHLPVVADIDIYDRNSLRLRERGPGVINTMEAQ